MNILAGGITSYRQNGLSKSFKKRNRTLIEEGGDVSEEFKYEDYVEQQKRLFLHQNEY